MKINKRHIAPVYNRIPHFNKDISNMTHDDIALDTPLQFPLQFPFECYIEEKVDGANMGVSFAYVEPDTPILRNHDHILKKGYTKTHTPAKRQFTSAWNWLHKHKDDLHTISASWDSDVTIYGDWLFAQHSIFYDRLPDLFIAYDIWSVEDHAYLSPKKVESLLSKTKIKFVKPHKVVLNSIEELIEWSEKPSDYRNGIREGVVIKQADGDFCTNMFKVVNRHFVRRDDFNERLLKNTLL